MAHAATQPGMTIKPAEYAYAVPRSTACGAVLDRFRGGVIATSGARKQSPTTSKAETASPGCSLEGTCPARDGASLTLLAVTMDAIGRWLRFQQRREQRVLEAILPVSMPGSLSEWASKESESRL